MKCAVLIGHNFSSIIGLARALGRDGFYVGAIRTWIKASRNPIREVGKKPESKSKYIKKYTSINDANEESIVNLLLNDYRIKDNKSVIFPLDDVCAKIIDNNIEKLKPFYYMPNVNYVQGSITTLMNKSYQKELAKKFELPVAAGHLLTLKDKEYDIPSNIDYPCFIKAAMPVRGRKSLMGKCSRKEDLEKYATRALELGCSKMLIENYLKIEKEYCIVGFCNKEKVAIPAVIDEIVLGHGAHSGVTCYGKVCNPELLGPFVDKLKRFMSSLDFCGLFTIDVIESNGVLYFCELNVRIGGSGIAIIGAGVDIAEMCARALSGEKAIDYDQTCIEMTFASERPLMNEFSLGLISWKQYIEYLKKADYRFIYDANDISPYCSYVIFVLKQIINRFRKI